MVLVRQKLVIVLAHDCVRVNADPVLLIPCDEPTPYVHVIVVNDVGRFGSLTPLSRQPIMFGLLVSMRHVLFFIHRVS